MTTATTSSIDTTSVIRRALVAWDVTVLREIGGGHSGARVLVVDLAAAKEADGHQHTETFEPGQYVLKVQPAVTCVGESPESTRHLEAAAVNAEFSIQHIPALRHFANIDGASLLLYEIAGQSLANFVVTLR